MKLISFSLSLSFILNLLRSKSICTRLVEMREIERESEYTKSYACHVIIIIIIVILWIQGNGNMYGNLSNPAEKCCICIRICVWVYNMSFHVCMFIMIAR